MEPLFFFTGLLNGSEEIGMLERSSSAWHPYLWPVKVMMVIGITLMLLQCISEFLKDILRLKGELV
jgi:TRAP-type mannitol/chloroaromatic compound transport system permease small subunit